MVRYNTGTFCRVEVLRKKIKIVRDNYTDVESTQWVSLIGERERHYSDKFDHAWDFVPRVFMNFE